MAILLWHLNKSLVRLAGCVVGAAPEAEPSCRYYKFSSQKLRTQIGRRDAEGQQASCMYALSTLEPLLTLKYWGSSQLQSSKEAHLRSGRQRNRKDRFTSLLISVTMAKQLSTWESGSASFKF